MRRQGKVVEVATKPVPVSAPTSSPSSKVEQTDTISVPMEIEEKSDAAVAKTPEKKSGAAPIASKKKSKKKSSYKSMMAGIVQGNSSDRDSEKEKEQIRRVTGGGAFSKIDRI